MWSQAETVYGDLLCGREMGSLKDGTASQRNPASNGLMERLRDDIILGKYADNEKISEIRLTQVYGTSRTVVRGVLSLLEREGLIETQANGTRRVVSLKTRDIENLYEMRIYLEQTAVRQLGAERSDYRPILEAVQRIAASSDDDARRLLDIDMAFHRSVIEASRNRALLQAWDAISGVIQAICRLNLTDSQEYRQWFLQTFRERHMGLFLAAMGDGDEAVRLFGEHITDAQAVSRRAFIKLSGRSGEENT